METPYEDNIFDKIIRKEIPKDFIYEDEYVVAFLDMHPNNPGHTLVLPKKQIRNILDMDEETAAHLFRVIPKIANAVQKATNADGVNVTMNNEAAAGQAVFHAHVHIIPRFEGDGFENFAPGEYEYPEQPAEILEKIRGLLS